MSGELAPGRKLPPERELAQLLGVSRGLVRESIHELALKGLVSRRQGRGTEVRGPHRSEFTGAIVGYLTQNAREVAELLDFREALEPPIAARAAERATGVDVQRLQRITTELAAEGGSRAGGRPGRRVPPRDRARDPKPRTGEAGRDVDGSAEPDPSPQSADARSGGGCRARPTAPSWPRSRRATRGGGAGDDQSHPRRRQPGDGRRRRSPVTSQRTGERTMTEDRLDLYKQLRSGRPLPGRVPPPGRGTRPRRADHRRHPEPPAATGARRTSSSAVASDSAGSAPPSRHRRRAASSPS